MATYADILTDVNTLIANNSTSFTASTARVVRRQFVKLPGDPTTLCIISPQGWQIAEEGFEGKVKIDFLVGLVFIYPGNLQLETGLAAILNELDAIRKALHVTSLATATNVMDSSLDLRPPFDLDALSKTNFDFCPMLVTYRSDETRN